MKKLMIAVLAASTFTVFADEARNENGENARNAEMVQSKTPLFWGFGSYGVYSGYQLYGSLVNREPTAQGYAEANMNLAVSDVDLGYAGVGIWSNSDLTKNRNDKYGRIFNEWDFNVHWGKTFWIDDDKTWGLDYRTSVVWYYYPHRMYQKGRTGGKRQDTDTTMDWNHSFALLNPYVVPYINVVHEYHESDGNLLQFGLKRDVSVSDRLTLTPMVEMVWRNSHYNWCFPTAFGDERLDHGQAFSTLKLELDATYMITDHLGIFAKVAYCSVVDKGLRDNIDNRDVYPDIMQWGYYGMKDKDYVWGGAGVCFNF